jgi:hypothetical protein
MDHLGSYLPLMKYGVKGWDIGLTRLSCPGANPTEFFSSSFEEYLRTIGADQKTHHLAWKRWDQVVRTKEQGARMATVRNLLQPWRIQPQHRPHLAPFVLADLSHQSQPHA